MKKLLSLLIIGSILGVNIFTGFLGGSVKISYAGSTECSIEDGTPELEWYIAEMRKQTQKTIYSIVSNPKYNPALNDKLKKKKRLEEEKENGTDFMDSFDEIEEKYEKTQAQVKNYLFGNGQRVYEIARDLSRMLPGWDTYILSWGFWIGAIGYDYSLPIAVKRDFDMLRDETDRIKIYMENLINSGINANPDFDKNSHIIGLPGLLELNKLMEYAFMAAVIEGFSNNTYAMRQAQKAKENLQKYIGKYNINLSTDFLGEYTSIIKNEECRQSADPIDSIIETWEDGFDGVFDDWEEAYDLAMGLSGQGSWWQKYKMRKRKRELLSSFYKELADEMPKKREETEKLFQNLSVKNSLKIVQNMASDRTEQEFDNFMQYINQLSDTYNDFENKIMPNGYTPITAKDLTNNSDKEFSKVEKMIEIRNIYEELKYLEPGTGKEQSDLKSSILDNHKTIAEAIKYLEKTTPLAEKVCKSQGVGRGKCNSREYTKTK